MPLPMVHLAVAHELAQRRAISFDPGLYYIGAIAPDGIHARAGATREDKRRVYLASQTEQSLRARLESIQEFRASYERSVEESLLIGWVTHLVTDSIWSRHLVHGVWAEAAEGWSHEQRTRAYYDEADKIDFILYRTAPWRDRLLRWFTELKEEPAVEPGVITMRRVRRFVDVCVTVLSHGLDSSLAGGVDAVPGISGHDLLRDGQTSTSPCTPGFPSAPTACTCPE